jgi:hypothetical protein
MLLLDHTYDSFPTRALFTNGALTYSKDLVKFQAPKWREVLGPNDILSTCIKPPEFNLTGSYNTVVWYLHTYPYHIPVERVVEHIRQRTVKYKRLILVTAYKEFRDLLLAAGLTAVYIPMSIDVKTVQQYASEEKRDAFIWYGNVMHNKKAIFSECKNEVKMIGLPFDYISRSMFNGTEPIDQGESFKRIATYKYGIGVGRCAQELMALGVKTVIAGQRHGGLITNDEEYEKQLATNMNGRIRTHNPHIIDSVKQLDKAICVANDIAIMDHPALANSQLDRPIGLAIALAIP